MRHYVRLYERDGKFILANKLDTFALAFQSAAARECYMHRLKDWGIEIIVLPMGELTDRSLEGLKRELQELDTWVAGVESLSTGRSWWPVLWPMDVP